MSNVNFSKTDHFETGKTSTQTFILSARPNVLLPFCSLSGLLHFFCDLVSTQLSSCLFFSTSLAHFASSNFRRFSSKAPTENAPHRAFLSWRSGQQFELHLRQYFTNRVLFLGDDGHVLYQARVILFFEKGVKFLGP